MAFASQQGYSGAMAWADQTNGHPAEYFVFHACDGAGLQSDCKGDVKYIERFGQFAGDFKRGPDGGSWSKGKTNDQDVRRFYKFARPDDSKLPGTQIAYDDYQAGWWCDGTITAKCDMSAASGGDWSRHAFLGDLINKNKPEQALPNGWFNGQHPFEKGGQNSGVGKDKDGVRFSFMLFPWRCTKDDTLLNPPTNIFSYPTIQDNGYKCYADNEPCGDDPGKCIGFPMFVEVYFGLLTTDASGDVIYMLRYDVTDDGDWGHGPKSVIDTGNPITLKPYWDYWY